MTVSRLKTRKHKPKTKELRSIQLLVQQADFLCLCGKDFYEAMRKVLLSHFQLLSLTFFVLYAGCSEAVIADGGLLSL